MLKSVLRSTLAIAITTLSPTYAANSISSSSATLDSPLSGEEASKIKANKNWPERFSVKIKKCSDETLQSLKAIPELRNLYIYSDIKISSLTPLSKLNELRSLSIRKSKHKGNLQLDLSPLQNCTQLEKLDLTGSPLTGLNAIASCPQLTDFRLNNASLSSLEFLAEMPWIISLSIGGDEQKFTNYEAIAQLKNLQRLDIHDNQQANDSSLGFVSKLKDLQHIDIRYCDEITSLDFLSECTELEVIEAERCKQLSNLKGLQQLQLLSNAKFSDCPIMKIEGLGNKPFLETLSLSGTKVSDISDLAKSMHLEKLLLGKTKVTDLSPLATMQRLEYLDLSGSHADINTLPKLRRLSDIRLDDTATKELKSLHRLPILESVDLRDTLVSDFASLAKIKTLEKISLSKSTPASAVETIKAARPDIAVKLN